jgi:hypothetical protein
VNENKTKDIFRYMEKNFIRYAGKDYEIKEPTIELWAKMVGLKDWNDETEFAVMLISEITGLKKKEIETADWQNVLLAAQNISNYLLHESKEFHNEFIHDGIKYKFIDLPNLTFGEFIDIDSFLQKDEFERRRELNFLMALLYREVKGDGKISEYDGSKIPQRAERFKKLPVKYVNGATSFFLLLGKTLQGNSKLSLWSRLRMRMKIIWILVKLTALTSFGVGLALWSRWLTKISPKWKK